MATDHEVPGITREELACYCCGESFRASDLVRFEQHPRDGVCIACAAWLHQRSQPIDRQIHPPFWWRFIPRRFRRS